MRQVKAGQSVAVVAKRLGVRPGTLSWWLWRLGRARPAQPKRPKQRSASVTFLPVVAAESVPTQRSIEIDVAGTRLRVEVGVDVSYVVALVGALRAC